MKRRIAVFLLVVFICGFVSQFNISAEQGETENKVTLEDYLKTLTPEEVLKRSNQDMKELYGLKDFYPKKAHGRQLNTTLLQQQINEAIQNPKKFKGFDIVYGTSHGTTITHKGQTMQRYSGYNVFGDPVSMDGFPWDAGWSGTKSDEGST